MKIKFKHLAKNLTEEKLPPQQLLPENDVNCLLDLIC